MKDQIPNKKFIDLLSKVPNIAIQGYNKDRVVIYWNKASEVIYGYTESEAIGQKLEDLIIPDFMRDEVISHVDNWYKNGIEIPSGELPLINKNGSTIYVYSSHVMLDQGTDNPEMFCIDIDLSKNKEQERLLQLSNIVVENSPVVLFRWKAQEGWPVEYVSSNVKLFGYSTQELLSGITPYSNLIHKDDLARVGKEVEEYSKLNINSFCQEYRIVSPEKKIFYIDDRTTIIRDEDGKITHYEGIILDITEKKLQYEKERNLLNQAIDSISDAAFLTNKKNKFVYVNEAAARTLQYSKEELCSLHVQDIDPIHTDEVCNKLWPELLKHKTLKIETKQKRKDEVFVPVELVANLIKYKDDDYALAIARDISERKKYEAELIEEKEKFESIFNYAGDGIAIVDLDGNFLKINNSFIDIIGYSEKELLAKNCTDLTAKQYQEINKKALQDTIKKGYVDNVEKSCITKDNSFINVIMSMSLLPDKKSILLIVHDTTKLKLLQEQDKLASLGEMIGNIAHQWRQPLSMITSSISALRLQSELDEKITKDDITKYSDIINYQADYLSNTIDHFRDFIKGDLTYKNIDFNESLKNAIELVNASLKENFITLHTNIEDNITVYGNSNELSQVFINILNNAKDALKANIENEEERLILITSSKDSSKVKISIKDSAGGINSRIKDKIFEPYFTTKHNYVGTGLGLSMSYKIIVERHNGILEAKNISFEYNGKKYKGACFTITLNVV